MAPDYQIRRAGPDDHAGVTRELAAYFGLSGLGRLLIDGIALNQYDRVIAGAILVAALAIVLDLFAGWLQQAVVSPGVSGRALTRTARRPRNTVPSRLPSGSAN